MRPRKAALLVVGFAAVVSALALLERPRPVSSAAPVVTDFTNFESAPVHPIALSPNGQRLFALDIPDARLRAARFLGTAARDPAGIPTVVDETRLTQR